MAATSQVNDVATASRSLPRWVAPFGLTAFTSSVAIDAVYLRHWWSMLDLRIYRWAGLVARHSGDLYDLRFPHHQLGFTYPPMAALVFAVASLMALPILKWLVAIGSIASLLAISWLTWGALGYRRRTDRVWLTLAVAGLALWLEPVQQVLWYGQVNLVLMLIVMADLLLPDSRWFKGIGVGLAAGFKLTPLIFVPYLLLTRRYRAAGTALATFALTIAGSLVLLPAQSREYWFGGRFLNPRWIGNVAFVGNQSLRGTLLRLFGSDAAARPYWLGCVLVVGICGLLLAARAARRGNEMLGVVTCALTGLLISPVSWAHHWVWIVPGFIVVADLVIATHVRALPGPAPDATVHPAPDPAGGSGGSPPQVSTAGQPAWRRWPGWPWLGLAALAAPFFVLPQALVPAAMVNGYGVSGLSHLTGELYVVVGLVALCLVALHIARGRRGRSRQAPDAAPDPERGQPVS